MAYQLKKIIRYFLMLTGITILFIFCYLCFGGYIITNKQERQQLFKDIKLAPKLPDNFLKVYKTLYPEALKNNGWHYLFTNEGFNKQIESPSVEMAILYGQTRLHGSFGYFVQYNFMIEDNITQEQCLNRILQVTDFGRGIIGVEEASKQYFHKPLKMLSDMKTLEIITRIQNPQLYDKQRRPKIFEDRLNTLKNQFRKNKSELLKS
ncbi:hypothetical protein Q765_11875 [Flavobacterium rivuli WB 3.3-2 = DSM 21788]|uniref:Glycosyl transferase family 51 domain-containing protein n=1 Tax=Flavobacterium rivuli WB 3.3-2 = DSM 21788 TaxID=1121895 RepID=A0A0A2M3V3_9FLAO|nr:transglycosylase domain-containing protein [Flavobacterium rivuli]KGO86271.1 hypothetical protein Q765_11875 [Flavobacterium rivuli WB 3.3-2 = DSM 21788]